VTGSILRSFSVLNDNVFFFGNLLLIFFWFRAVFDALVRILKRAIDLTPSDVFFALTPVAPIVRNQMLWSSMSTDLPAALLSFLTVYSFIRQYECRDVPAQFAHFAVSLVTAVFVVTIKLSAIVWVLLPSASLFLTQHADIRRRLVSFLAVAAAFGLVFVIRGYWLSGMPAYPSTLLSLEQLPWTVSNEAARNEMITIIGWARAPGPGFRNAVEGFAWFPSWLSRNIIDLMIWAVLLLISAIAFLISLKQSRLGFRKYFISPLVVALIGIVFWFVSAPAIRFGVAALYTPVFLLGSLAVVNSCEKRLTWQCSFFRSGVALGLFVFVVTFSFRYWVELYDDDTAMVDAYLSRPDTEGYIRLTNEGEAIWVPSEGDRAWNLPLPNTPCNRFRANLQIVRQEDVIVEFRVPRNLNQGAAE
jgi:hypothetical protein